MAFKIKQPNDTKKAADDAWEELMIQCEAANDGPSLRRVANTAASLYRKALANGWGAEEAWWFLLVYSDARERSGN